MVLESTEATFQNDVLNEAGVVLVDFYAPWCGPCKMIAPILDELSKTIYNIKFVKVNVDDSPQLAQTLGISGVPTLILYKNGEIIANKVGGMNKEAMLNFINQDSPS